jgi:hypothetical protein
MSNIRLLVEASWIKEGTEMEGEPLYERNFYYLLHWGLDYQIIETDEAKMPVNFTVAICQNKKTGQIECFRPYQLRVIGREIKDG